MMFFFLLGLDHINLMKMRPGCQYVRALQVRALLRDILTALGFNIYISSLMVPGLGIKEVHIAI